MLVGEMFNFGVFIPSLPVGIEWGWRGLGWNYPPVPAGDAEFPLSLLSALKIKSHQLGAAFSVEKYSEIKV